MATLIAQENAAVTDNGSSTSGSTYWTSHDTPPTYVASGYSASTDDHDSETIIDFYVSHQVPYPLGSYLNNCMLVVAAGNEISAHCPDNHDNFVNTTINYTTVCKPGSTLSNINGYLSCDEYSQTLTDLFSTADDFSKNVSTWLSADNSSCIIQDITENGNSSQDYENVTNIEAMCVQSDGTYRESNQNPQQCKTSPYAMTNDNGHLDCVSSN